MKAIIFTKYGSADGLQLCEVSTPVSADDELLIEEHASSVNSWDWGYLNGTPIFNWLMFGFLNPKSVKEVLVADIAQTVRTVGAHVTKGRLGDEVFGDRWSNWGALRSMPVRVSRPLKSNLPM